MKTMKRFGVSILCLILLVLVLPAQGAGATGPFTDSWSEPVDVTVYNPCSGEWVWLTGRMHILYHDNLTPSGRLMWETRISYNKVRGVGLSSGKPYVGVGVDQGGGSTLVDPAQTPYHYHAASQKTMSLVGKGRTENYKVIMNFHIVYTPDYESHAWFENFRIACR
jgi:hypothetical protein